LKETRSEESDERTNCPILREKLVAIKIKKKSNKPTDEELLEQDDQILETSKETFSWLSENRNLVIGLLVATVVLILGLTWYLDHRKSRIAEASAATYDALAVTFRPVGEAPPAREGEEPIPESEVFATQTAKLETLREQAQAVVSEYENRRAGNEARLLAASAALELGDFGDALDGYQAFRNSSDTRLGELIATLGEATATAGEGDLDGALSAIDEIMGRFDSLRPHLALHKARLIDTYGNDADALEAYKQILNSDYSLETVDTGQIETRVALLEIQLGEAGEGPAEQDSAPAEDSAQESE
jgi:predicted negative regulator of RcsB-dependent stress response